MTLFIWICAGCAVVAVAVAVAVAMRWAPRAELVTRVDIAAAPEQVWALLGQPATYAGWNPFIVSMQGVLEEGQVLDNVMQPANGKRMRFRPTVRKVDPGRELRWLGRLWVPGLFDGEHYMVLHASADGASTQLVHGEKFSGLLLWLVDVERFRPDFERMNRALKNAVEQKEEHECGLHRALGRDGT